MNWTMVRHVAAREIRTRGRTKAFRVITAFLVAAAVIGPVVAALWPTGSDDLRQVNVGVVDIDDTTQKAIEAAASGSFEIVFEDLSAETTSAIDEAVSGGGIDVVIEPGPTLVWNQETDFETAAIINAVLQQEAAFTRGQSLGIGQQDTAALLTPLQFHERFVDQPDESDGLATAVAAVGLIAAFVIPQTFGQLTLMSVVEEKSTRVIEVLLSHIRPRTLLFGKVLGLCVLAAAQLAVAVGGLTAALLLTNTVDIPASVWRFVPVILISILGGLAIYNTFFALLGSLISRQEDAAQVMLPLVIPLMAGLFAGQAAVFDNAESTVAKALTLFPLTAPMLLPVRVARDAIEPWEVTLSICLLALGTWALIRIAGRVYEHTLLHTGSRVSWNQLLHLSHGKTLDESKAATQLAYRQGG